MEEDLIFKGQKYISAKRAAELTQYTSNYIEQLFRSGKIASQRIGDTWYVEEQSLLNYHESQQGITNLSEPIAFVENSQDNKEVVAFPASEKTEAPMKQNENNQIMPLSMALTTPISRALVLKAGALGFALALIFGQTVLHGQLAENLKEGSVMVFSSMGEKIISVTTEVGVASVSSATDGIHALSEVLALVSVNVYSRIASVITHNNVSGEMPLSIVKESMRDGVMFPITTVHSGFSATINDYVIAGNFWRDMLVASLDKALVVQGQVLSDLAVGYGNTKDSVATAFSGLAGIGETKLVAQSIHGGEMLAYYVYENLCGLFGICQ
jgi:hypothetical protein